MTALRGVEALLVYNAAFERGRLLELAADLPDLARELHAAADRTFDLPPVVRCAWYHRDMRGSRSLKAVLPTIFGADPMPGWKACAKARARNSPNLKRWTWPRRGKGSANSTDN